MNILTLRCIHEKIFEKDICPVYNKTIWNKVQKSKIFFKYEIRINSEARYFYQLLNEDTPVLIDQFRSDTRCRRVRLSIWTDADRDKN